MIHQKPNMLMLPKQAPAPPVPSFMPSLSGDPVAIAIWTEVHEVARWMERLRRSRRLNDLSYGFLENHIIRRTYAILDGSKPGPDEFDTIEELAKWLARICRRFQPGRDDPIGPRVFGLLWYALQDARQRRRA